MSPISVIHAPRDEALGEKIAAALVNAGHAATRVISDPDQGDLDASAREDGAAIVVWTEAAAKLARLRDQAMAAMARGALIPVAVGGARPPGGFENLPPVDLSGWTGAADDPRWRFVLEEVHLATRRNLLRNGEVWSAPQNDETPGSSPAERRQPAAPPVSEPARKRGFSFARRFSAREVAIGASAGLVLMTAATALLAPIVLPAAFDAPLSQPPLAGASLTPSAPSDLTPSDRAPATPSPALTADAESDDPSPGTLVTLATLRAPDLVDVPGAEHREAMPEEHNRLMEISDADDIIYRTGGDPAFMVMESTDDTSGAEAMGEDMAGADSDAMENLIAAVSAEAGEMTPSLDAIESLPATVAENAYLGNYFKECVECPDMAALPAGSFRMGARAGETTRGEAERPALDVSISRRFAIGTREVTYAQWDACVADGGCAHAPGDHGWGRGKQPVVSVSYEDAVAYTVWLSEKTGQSYRLPTEAEWEYAARGGASGAFAFGDDVTTRQANFNGEFPYRGAPQAFRRRTTPAASFPPNAFGLFDMHGNAWEWTADCWNASHAGAPADGSARTSGDCSRRVLKGGAWNTGAWRLRAAHRIAKPQSAREFDNGFRVARDLD